MGRLRAWKNSHTVYIWLEYVIVILTLSKAISYINCLYVKS
jgi:hypothetical protein